MTRFRTPELNYPAKVDLNALAAVSRFAGTDDGRSYLMGVRVEVGPRDVVYVATDGKRLLAMRQEKLRDDPDNDLTGRFTIPTQHCRAFKLKKDQDPVADLYGDDERLTLSWRDTEVTFTPLRDGDFIGRWVDWRHVIPRFSGSTEAAQFDHTVLASFQKFADEMPGGFYPFVVHNGRDGGALIRFPQLDAIGVAMPVKIDFQRSAPLPSWALSDDFYSWERGPHRSEDAEQRANGDAQNLGDAVDDLVDRLKRSRGEDQAPASQAGGASETPAPETPDGDEAAGGAGDGLPPFDIGGADAGDGLAAAAQREALGLGGIGALSQAELDALTPEQRQNVERLEGIQALKPGQAEPIATAEDGDGGTVAIPSDAPKRRGRKTTEQRVADNARAVDAGRML